ncbi:hypothetical protein D3C85_1089250 [compost metagenome]
MAVRAHTIPEPLRMKGRALQCPGPALRAIKHPGPGAATLMAPGPIRVRNATVKLRHGFIGGADKIWTRNSGWNVGAKGARTFIKRG